MKKFKLIEHTADIGIIAEGLTLVESFSNAAYGLFSLITDLRKVRKLNEYTIELKENSPEDLLYSWLNQLIYLIDTEKMLFKQCVICEFDGYSLKAYCNGEKYDVLRHKIKNGPKAATYYNLKVDKENNMVQVIFDI
jgi:SHS2 domain-containing protein